MGIDVPQPARFFVQAAQFPHHPGSHTGPILAGKGILKIGRRRGSGALSGKK